MSDKDKKEEERKAREDQVKATLEEMERETAESVKINLTDPNRGDANLVHATNRSTPMAKSNEEIRRLEKEAFDKYMKEQEKLNEEAKKTQATLDAFDKKTKRDKEAKEAEQREQLEEDSKKQLEEAEKKVRDRLNKMNERRGRGKT
jgi:hypothetical protein